MNGTRNVKKIDVPILYLINFVDDFFFFFYRFKDNRPYPWPGDVSSFILNPESANQTIYTTSLTSSDHGFYTCQLVNQMNILNHSMKLATIGECSSTSNLYLLVIISVI